MGEYWVATSTPTQRRGLDEEGDPGLELELEASGREEATGSGACRVWIGTEREVDEVAGAAVDCRREDGAGIREAASRSEGVGA